MWNKALNNGLIGGLIGVALTLLGTVTGLSPVEGVEEWNFASFVFSILGFAIWIYFIMRAMKQFRDEENGGVMSYGQGLGVGILTALVMGVIGALYYIIHLYLIDPAALELMRENFETQYEDSGMSEDEIESFEWMINLFTSPVVMGILSVFYTVFWGLIISLIGAAIAKRDATG